MYGTSDKEKFQCAYPEWEAKRPDTTFYADFSVADVYGENAIKETYKRCKRRRLRNDERKTVNHNVHYIYKRCRLSKQFFYIKQNLIYKENHKKEKEGNKKVKKQILKKILYKNMIFQASSFKYTNLKLRII